MLQHDFLKQDAQQLYDVAVRHGVKIATAESCTGGLIAASITDIPGSSEYFEGGFVTYSNELKHRVLRVELSLLKQFGAVSEEVAKAMAIGSINLTHADITLSVTGIAGPGGGSAEKPVGTVYFAVAWNADHGTQTSCFLYNFSGDRSQIRLQSAKEGLRLLYERVLLLRRS